MVLLSLPSRRIPTRRSRKYWGLGAESLGAATSGSASLLVLHKAGEANTESIEEAEGE
jgi:hypothetical protein